MNEAPQAGPELAKIVEVVAFVPDGNAEAYDGAHILGAGMVGPTPVAKVVDEKGRHIDYLGIPLKVTREAPSGLVAARSGGLIIPPKS